MGILSRLIRYFVVYVLNFNFYILFFISIFLKSTNVVISAEDEVKNEYSELKESDFIIGNILLEFKEIPYKQLIVI